MEQEDEESLDELLYRIHTTNDWIGSKKKRWIRINNPNVRNPTQPSGQPQNSLHNPNICLGCYVLPTADGPLGMWQGSIVTPCYSKDLTLVCVTTVPSPQLTVGDSGSSSRLSALFFFKLGCLA